MLRHWLSLVLPALLQFAAAIGMSPSLAVAQSYTVESVDERMQDPKAAKRYHANVAKVLIGSLDMDSGRKVLDVYYKRYLLPALTDPANYGAYYGDLRIDMQKDLANARSQDARVYIIKTIYSGCSMIADDAKYDPAARYNALLFLGDLNESEAVLRGSTAVPPVPYGKIFGDLYKRFRDPANPSYVRLGALLGMIRHAELRTLENSPKPLPAAAKIAVAKSAAELLATQKPAANEDISGHDWMRRRAADLLGALGQAGPGDVFAKQLADTLLEADASLGLRCACAQALGKIDLSQSKLDPKQLANDLGQLAADCAKSELDVLKELLQAGSRGGEAGRSYSPRGPRGEFGMPDENDDGIVFADPQTVPSRRRLAARLEQVRAGLVGDGRKSKGVAGSLPGAAEPIAMISPLVDKLLAAAKDPDKRGVGDLGSSLAGDVTALTKLIAQSRPPTDATPVKPDPGAAAAVE